MNHQTPAIVVVTYNRANDLLRLLSSLSCANYKSFKDIILIISIDGGGPDEIFEIAQNYIWPYGEKVVIRHPENMGLKNHIIQCGDLSNQYESIVIFEDDLIVSPDYYIFAVTSLEKYHFDINISGISLFNPSINEPAHLPFYSLKDGFDNYFMQVPSSLGQIWTKNWWCDFKKFLKNPIKVNLPKRVDNWPATTSWKKIFYQYNLKFNKYYVYPINSYVAHIVNNGVHYSKKNFLFISEMFFRNKFPHLSDFKESNSKYDGFNEIKSIIIQRNNDDFKNYDFDCDLNGIKEQKDIKKAFLLSSKPCKNPILKFGFELYPPELNILMNIPGDFFFFGKTNNFGEYDWNKRYDFENIYIKQEFLYSVKNKINTISRAKIKKEKEYKVGQIILYPIIFTKKIVKYVKKKLT